MRLCTVLSLAVVILLSCTGPLWPQTTAPKAVIFFGNGVWNSTRMARHSAGLLRSEFKARHFPLLVDEAFDTAFPFDYAKNETACIDDPPDPLRDPNCLIDLQEALQQAAQAGGFTFGYQDFWRFLLGLTLDFPNITEIFAAVLQAKALSFDPLAVTFDDLQEQVTTYRETIDNGSKVLLVAHSQGNLFGNQAFNFISPSQRRSFGMVSVATPASFVAGGGPYTTLEQDFIHKVFGALPPNTSSIGCGAPLTCHGFIGSYLAEDESREKILDDMLAVLDSLVYPGPEPVTPDTLIVLDDYYDRLLIVDPATGQTKFLIHLSRDFLAGLAYDRVSRLLYTFDIVAKELVEINLVARTERAVGVVGTRHITDMTFGLDNVLFGMECGEFSMCRLVEIDTSTGVGTPRGPLLAAQPTTLVYDPDLQTMYTTRNTIGGSLYEIDPATGTERFLSQGPAGVAYMAERPGSSDVFAIARQPFSNNINTVGSFDPAAPEFRSIVRIGQMLSGIEMVSLDGVVIGQSQPPAMRFNALEQDHGGTFNLLYPISWTDEDPDSAALIALSYSTDPSCAHPTLISANISEDGIDQYDWDVSSVPEGAYYLQGIIVDGVNPAVRTCSRNFVRIGH